jgi:hypothetical protein
LPEQAARSRPKAAQSQKAIDEVVQQKQTAEAAIAELRQSLRQERDRTEAMARDLASARRTMDGGVTVGRSADSYVVPVTQAVKTAVTEPPKAAEVSHEIAAPDRAARGGEAWIISETTSPVDYTPIVTATAFSRGGSDGSLMQLAIYCRRGRTELVLSGPALSNGGADYTISYRVNDGQPVQLAARLPSFGTGAAFPGDVVHLLQSLPEEGHIAVRITTRSGAAPDAFFCLAD